MSTIPDWNCLKEGNCFVCGKKTNSIHSNPKLWGFYFPHIDGQGKHRIYHMKCLYAILKSDKEGNL